MTLIIKYIEIEALLEDKVQARCLQLGAARYVIIEGQLYKRSFSLPLLKYITPEQGMTVLKDIHKGVCENHIMGQSLVYKMIKRGYFLLTLRKDAMHMLSLVIDEKFSPPTIKRAPKELTYIYSP